MKSILLLLILVFVTTVSAQIRSTDKQQMVGVWQNSQGVGSGLTDNYQFFENGRFRLNFNEMDGTKRVISHSGFWNVYRGRLYLHVTAMRIHFGGRWVKASGSIATEYEIEGGEIRYVRLRRPEKFSYAVSAITEEDVYTVVTIGDAKFWKLSGDPRAYESL